MKVRCYVKVNWNVVSYIFEIAPRASEKVTQKFLRNGFTLSIVSMATEELMIGILWFLNNVKHMSSLKKKKTFGNTGLKLFTQ